MELYGVWLWYKIDGEEGYIRQNSDEFDDVQIKRKLNRKCETKQEDPYILAWTGAIMPGLVSSSSKWPHGLTFHFSHLVQMPYLEKSLRFFRKYMHI